MLLAASPVKKGSATREIQLYRAKAKEYLTSMSFNYKPPALAAWPGLSSYTNLLFKSIAFHMLHVMDLGLLCFILDMVCDTFSQKEYWPNGIKAGLIRIVNQRFIDLPLGVNIKRRTSFLTNKTEVLSGMTGRERRETLPFLRAMLMGMNPSVNPDDNELIRTALHLNDVYSRMAGIKLNRFEQYRSVGEIIQLEQDAFKLGNS